jgi:D-proline reductase (dithiol) PrdB
VDRLAYERQVACQHVATFEWAREGPPAWVPLRPGLRGRRLGFVTSGGFYVRGEQEPFDDDPTRSDLSVRVIPADVSPEALGISHRFYDHRYVRQDLETMVPIRTLQDAAAEGLVGSLCERFVSFMGYLPHWEGIPHRLAPAVLMALEELEAEAVLLSPG